MTNPECRSLNRKVHPDVIQRTYDRKLKLVENSCSTSVMEEVECAYGSFTLCTESLLLLSIFKRVWPLPFVPE